jgi:molybdenum cofactor biosynthesis protein MoaC
VSTLPRSSYAFLNASIPSNMTSIRAYHDQPSLLDNASRQQDPPPMEEDDTELPPNVYELSDTERVQLKAVWDNGMSESNPLSESVEIVRQKYEMTDPLYDHYWRLAAGSLTPVLHANAKARRKLRTIEHTKEKLGEPSLVPKKTGGTSSHGTLMREAIRISKYMRAVQVKELTADQTDLKYAPDRDARLRKIAQLDKDYGSLRKNLGRELAFLEYPRKQGMGSSASTKNETRVSGLRDVTVTDMSPRKKVRDSHDFSGMLENLSQSQKTGSRPSANTTKQDLGYFRRLENTISRPQKKARDGEDYSALLENLSQSQRTASSSLTKNVNQESEPNKRLQHSQEEYFEAFQPLEGRRDVKKEHPEEDPDDKEIRQQVEGLMRDMETYRPVVESPDMIDAEYNFGDVSKSSFNANAGQKWHGAHPESQVTSDYHRTKILRIRNHAKEPALESEQQDKYEPSQTEALDHVEEPEQQETPELSARGAKRARWRETNKLLSGEEERNTWFEMESTRKTIGKEMKALNEDKQLALDAVQKAERKKRLRELSQQRIKLQKKKDELIEMLRAEEEAQLLSKKAREEAPLLAQQARRDKEASVELSDVLDVALEKALKGNGPVNDQKPPLRRVPSTGATAGAHRIKLTSTETDTSYEPMSLGRQPTQEAQDQFQDGITMSAPEQPSRPSSDLYLSVPASGEIPIDSTLTLALNTDTRTLQSQIRAMKSRLSASYPRIDRLPYDIAESENKQTLQTWLKVLAGRYQSRNDVQGTAQTDPQVKAVLDQMVRDHDLSNDAAKRVAEKWSEIFERRSKKASGIEDLLDNKEFEVAGLGFLRANEEVEPVDEVVAADSAERVEKREAVEGDDSTPISTKIAESSTTDISLGETEAARETSEQSISQDASFAADDSKATESTSLDEHEFVVEDANESIDQDKTDNSVTKDNTPKTIPIIAPSKPTNSKLTSLTRRLYSTSSRPPLPTSLPHLTSSGSAHMVSVSAKAHTTRTAIAVGTVSFSNPTPLSLIQSNSLKKGDVLSVSRIAGIMAAKKCPDLIPLCHPIALTHVGVELKTFSSTPTDSNDLGFGGVNIEAKVQCTGQTGVEMEALTSVMGTALSVVDMCKAVDKGMVVGDVRVVLKEGGRSGVWREEGWRSWQEE